MDVVSEGAFESVEVDVAASPLDDDDDAAAAAVAAAAAAVVVVAADDDDDDNAAADADAAPAVVPDADEEDVKCAGSFDLRDGFAWASSAARLATATATLGPEVALWLTAPP